MKDHTAEAAVISAMMNDETALITAIENLDPEHFHKPQFRTLFTTMCQMFESNITIDRVTIADRLEHSQQLDTIGGHGFLVELEDVALSGYNIQNHINIMIEKKLTRDAVKISNDTLMQIEQNEPITAVIDTTRERFMNIDSKITAHDYTAIDAVHSTMKRKEQAIKEGKPSGLKTYIHDLDNYIILKPGNVIVIGAKKGVGKSALANQIAFENAMNDKKIVIFNMEMEVDDIVDREISRLSSKKQHKINVSDINFGNFNLEHYQYYADVLADMNFIIDDNGYQTMAKIHSKLIKYRQKMKGLDLAVFDYLQLIRGGEGGNRQQQLADISRNAKLMAKHFGIPIIILSQLNHEFITREAEDSENDADIVLKLHRPAKDGYGTQIKEGKQKILRDGIWIEPEIEYSVVKIEKNRKGKTGMISLFFDGSHQSFNGWENNT